jgi:hypothetical protein
MANCCSTPPCFDQMVRTGLISQQPFGVVFLECGQPAFAIAFAIAIALAFAFAVAFALALALAIALAFAFALALAIAFPLNPTSPLPLPTRQRSRRRLLRASLFWRAQASGSFLVAARFQCRFAASFARKDNVNKNKHL